ncbi:hypothetical protein VKT23_014196 [Stygiomarasmius scandens]|uniref:Uncharacterized protein n=1 Tax=Marasmiellus scandens TaxID=2682957 RepID=A0ABR1J0Q3_9AGAR
MPNNSIYGGPWIGPPSSVFYPAVQTAAIQVLMNAISLEDQDDGLSGDVGSSMISIAPSSSTSPNNPPPSSSADNSAKSGSHTKAIIGGTIGAAILITFALGSAIYFFICKRKQAPLITPFLSRNPLPNFGLPPNCKAPSKGVDHAETAGQLVSETTGPADEIDTPELIQVLYRRLHIAKHPGGLILTEFRHEVRVERDNGNQQEQEQAPEPAALPNPNPEPNAPQNENRDENENPNVDPNLPPDPNANQNANQDANENRDRVRDRERDHNTTYERNLKLGG